MRPQLLLVLCVMMLNLVVTKAQMNESPASFSISGSMHLTKDLKVWNTYFMLKSDIAFRVNKKLIVGFNCFSYQSKSFTINADYWDGGVDIRNEGFGAGLFTQYYIPVFKGNSGLLCNATFEIYTYEVYRKIGNPQYGHVGQDPPWYISSSGQINKLNASLSPGIYVGLNETNLIELRVGAVYANRDQRSGRFEKGIAIGISQFQVTWRLLIKQNAKSKNVNQ